MLKLKNCYNIPLAQTLNTLVLITIPVWCGDPRGATMKIAAEVYYVKSMGTKVMSQHFVCAHDAFVPPLW